MTATTGDVRPTPLRDAARYWSRLIGAASGVVVTLGAIGVLSRDRTADLSAGLSKVDTLVAVVLGIVTTGSSVMSALRVVSTGERLVTPVADPRDAEGHPLVSRP